MLTKASDNTIWRFGAAILILFAVILTMTSVAGGSGVAESHDPGAETPSALDAGTSHTSTEVSGS